MSKITITSKVSSRATLPIKTTSHILYKDTVDKLGELANKYNLSRRDIIADGVLLAEEHYKKIAE